MPSPQSRRIQQLFGLACDLPQDQAAAFVREHCASEPEIAAEVMALLALDRAGNDLKTLASDAGDDPLLGADFGPFQLVSRLGEGGMGVVYLARQAPSGREVAFKIIRSPFASSIDRRRFLDEMCILAKLQHPGIAGFIHTADWRHDGRTYTGYGMELVRGQPLLEYIEQHRLGTRERIALLVKIAQAVDAAHTQNIIHRDLKPSNILVAPDGTAKVLDFGVARSLETEGVTLSGQIFGTVAYMAPEQANGDSRAISKATDVYALGLILFKALAGVLPYPVEGQSRADALGVILTATPQRIGVLCRDLRGDVETILRKALDRSPARRYHTAGELALDLERYLGHMPISARPPTVAYVLSRLAARHRVAASGVAAAAVAIVLGLGFSLSARAQAVAAARDLEHRRWDIFNTPDRLLKAIDVDKLGTILDDRGTHHDALATIDEVVIQPMLSDAEWDSPDQAESNAALANAAANYYRDAKWFDRAESLFQKTISIRLAQFGTDHPDVAAARANLGFLYLRMDRSGDAEPLLAQAVPVFRRQADPFWKPDLAAALDVLARARLDLGHGSEAEALYLEALSLRRSLHGETHPFFGRALMSYGRCLDELGRNAAALPLLHRAEAILELTLPADDLNLALARASLAAALITSGDLPSAQTRLAPLESVLNRPMAPSRTKERIYLAIIALNAAQESTDPGARGRTALWKARFDQWNRRRD